MSRGAQGVSLKCKYSSHPFSSDLTLYTIRCCFRLIKAPLRATRLQNESCWTLDHLQLFSRCPESGVFPRKKENLHLFLFTDFSMLHCHVSTVAQKRQTKQWLYRGPFVVFYMAGAFKESHLHHYYWIKMLNFKVKRWRDFKASGNQKLPGNKVV